MFNHTFLSNLGVTTSVLPDELYEIVMDEVEKIQNNLVDNEKWNTTLAGNIEKEYSLVKSIPHLEPFLSEMCNAYTSKCNNGEHFFEKNKRYRVHEKNIWVNIQRKHEFNPIHHHGGSFSFVCWLKIPYNLSDELNAPHVKNAANKAASAFQFVYPNILGQITLETLYVDKDWEKRIILFPAALSHCVYPFSTSDGYRISISGNLA
jgi:hypothetical protein